MMGNPKPRCGNTRHARPFQMSTYNWDDRKPPVVEVDRGKNFDISLGDVFERSLEGRPSISVDRSVLGGTPHILGTRIPVFMVLDAVEYYGTLDGALISYPNLKIEQVKDAVSLAAAVTEEPIDYKIETAAR